jgi:(p)ppGpp synthase/HD superfamily hydrolase
MMKKTNKLNDMLVLVAVSFDGREDKGGQPYVLHCLKVMHYVKSADVEVLQIAVGHDLIEDIAHITHAYLLEKGFSLRVADGIQALTKIPGEAPELYMARIKANPDAIRVKLADLRHNFDIRRLKGITQKDFRRMEKYQTMYMELSALVGPAL